MLKNIRLKPSEIFITQNKGSELKHTAVKGSLSLMISQGMSFGLSMINTILLARLLTPSDFGLIGMVTVFINFLIMFKDAGLSTATIQQDEITKPQISTLFWINGLISISLGLIILVSSPLVANFYKKPELTAVTAVLSISFIIQGFSIQHSALLQRHLKFTALAVNDIIAQLVSLIVAVVMAYFGFRYWALVGGTMSRSIMLVLLTIYSCPWMPGKMQKGTGVRSMLKFGGHLTGSYFVNYLSRNLDKLLIGRIIGAAPLGIYTRAFTLLMQPLSQIRGPLTTLSLPVLSSLKNNPVRFKNYFSKLLDISISLTLPITVYCFLESKFLILLLLGEQWIDAVPVFKILAIGGIFVATSGAPGVLMLSHGYSKRYMKLSIVTALMTSGSFIVGVFFGLNGVAIAYSAGSFLIMIPMIYFGIKGTPIHLGLILDTIKGPLLSAAIALLFAYFFKNAFPQENILKHILIGLIFFLVYFFMTLLRPETRETLKAIIGSLITKH